MKKILIPVAKKCPNQVVPGINLEPDGPKRENFELVFFDIK
jgi:hypothetical protein